MESGFSEQSASESAFGVRGKRVTTKMLELRMKTGETFAIGYHWLQSIHYVPTSTVELIFSTHTVAIKGRHLAELYSGLLEHQVPYIQEGSSVHDLTPESEPFVDSISLTLR